MSESQGLHASPSEWPRALFYVALLFSIYQIVTAAFHPVSSQVLRAGHVGFLLLLVFLCYPARGNGKPRVRQKTSAEAGLSTSSTRWSAVALWARATT